MMQLLQSMIYSFHFVVWALVLTSSPSFARALPGFTQTQFAQLEENISRQMMAEIKAGFSLFSKPWVEAPASTRVRDGLGPHFNATSCTTCHGNNGRGKPYRESGELAPALIVKLPKAKNDHPYGPQFQPHSLPGVPSEGSVRATFLKVLRGGKELIRPKLSFKNLAYGPLLKEETTFSLRLAPILAGLGVLSKIPSQTLLELADPKDHDRDGVSGVANWRWSASEQKKLMGRYGLRAQHPTLHDQVSAAFQNDLGITSPLHPNQNCAFGQMACKEKPSGGEFEISDKHRGYIVKMLKNIQPPKPIDSREKLLSHPGRRVFQKVSCHKCHRESYSVQGKRYYPYTDLLLHDMGEGLSDEVPSFRQSTVDERSWRTPPLWGLGSLNRVNGHTRLLHDGRARGIEEAILWHGGEAKNSREQYLQLSETEQGELKDFLRKL